MRITGNNVYFIISDENAGPKKPLVWCQLPVNFYFREFGLQGFSEENNEIFLELSTGMFLFK